MSVGQMLFSFDGRMTRLPFILIYIPIVIIATIARVSLDLLLELEKRRADTGLYWAALIVIVILVVWINFAVLVKRCHDRGKSGGWAMLSMIPLIGFLWAIIELGCFPGRRGPNEYGPDPRDPLPGDRKDTLSSSPEPLVSPPAVPAAQPSDPAPSTPMAAPLPAQPLGARQPPSIAETPVTTTPTSLDPALQPYSRGHRERTRLENQITPFGERALQYFRGLIQRGEPLAEAYRKTEADLRKFFHIASDESFERARRALVALKTASAEAHQEILNAYAALGSDLDWDAALERLKTHHKAVLDDADIAELAWLFDPAREPEHVPEPEPVRTMTVVKEPAPPTPQSTPAAAALEQPKQSFALPIAILVIVAIAGLVGFGFLSSGSTNKRIDPDVRAELVTAMEFSGDVEKIKKAIERGDIRQTPVVGLTRSSRAELDKRAPTLAPEDIISLELDQLWWTQAPAAKMTPIRILIDNRTGRAVAGLEFELSDLGCNAGGAKEAWIIDLARPVQPATRAYIDITLPVSDASLLHQNRLVCGIIRQAW